jgi:UDP-N-acetylmuramoyl-L-alanyl-D-glutamate--2,6-diaminopimelate ligase
LLKIPVEKIQHGIANVKAVPGRMERVKNSRNMVVLVDYAHTSDALEKTLQTLKDIGVKRLIVVFGCGGERDREKRPVMGRVAAKYSDVVIITSDNPRNESPEDIIREIEEGVLAERGPRLIEQRSSKDTALKGYLVDQDRRSAIRKAIDLALPGDVVLIAGKGHETTQQIGDKKIPFDDRAEAREALERKSVAVMN